MAAPSENVFEAEKSKGRPKGEFFSQYALKFDKLNPLQQVVPAISGNTPEDYAAFFGPYVLNIVAITGPYVRKNEDTDEYEWDDEDIARCKEIIQGAYKYFSLYECHIFIDADAPAAQDEDNEDGMAATAAKLGELDMGDVGITYEGSLSGGDVSSKVTQWISEFRDKVKDL